MQKAKWQDTKVLVTGGGGFIGSHLAEELVRRGASVRALVHYNALGRQGWLESSDLRTDMEIITGDLCDRDSVEMAVSGCDVIFHLGALIGIPYSYRSPGSYISTNIGGTHNVLQAARSHGASRVVHTSTSEVYGTADYVPIDETHPLKGQSPYSASKIGADKMAEAFCLSFNVPVVTVRPFNTYGPRQSMRAVIPTIIRQLADDRPVHLGNLRPTRDMNFVTDTVEGFIKAAESEHAIGQVVNLGSGREISIRELVMLIAGIMRKPVELVEDRTRLRPDSSEVERLLAHNGKARELLGWAPSVPLEEGLARTIEWFEANRACQDPQNYVV